MLQHHRHQKYDKDRVARVPYEELRDRTDKGERAGNVKDGADNDKRKSSDHNRHWREKARCKADQRADRDEPKDAHGHIDLRQRIRAAEQESEDEAGQWAIRMPHIEGEEHERVKASIVEECPAADGLVQKCCGNKEQQEEIFQEDDSGDGEQAEHRPPIRFFCELLVIKQAEDELLCCVSYHGFPTGYL